MAKGFKFLCHLTSFSGKGFGYLKTCRNNFLFILNLIKIKLNVVWKSSLRSNSFHEFHSKPSSGQTSGCFERKPKIKSYLDMNSRKTQTISVTICCGLMFSCRLRNPCWLTDSCSGGQRIEIVSNIFCSWVIKPKALFYESKEETIAEFCGHMFMDENKNKIIFHRLSATGMIVVRVAQGWIDVLWNGRWNWL